MSSAQVKNKTSATASWVNMWRKFKTLYFQHFILVLWHRLLQFGISGVFWGILKKSFYIKTRSSYFEFMVFLINFSFFFFTETFSYCIFHTYSSFLKVQRIGKINTSFELKVHCTFLWLEWIIEKNTLIWEKGCLLNIKTGATQQPKLLKIKIYRKSILSKCMIRIGVYNRWPVCLSYTWWPVCRHQRPSHSSSPDSSHLPHWTTIGQPPLVLYCHGICTWILPWINIEMNCSNLFMCNTAWWL